MKSLFALLLMLITLQCVFAAPYGEEGLALRYTQPDGNTVELRVFGDEFEATTETLDGYTVIFSDSDLYYYYAKSGGPNQDLVRSDFRVGRDDPKSLGVELHLTAPPIIRSIKRRASLVENQFRPDLDTESFVRGKPVGTFTGLCVLLAFADDPLDIPFPAQKIENMFNQIGYNEFGNSGSVRDYFLAESNGLFELNTQVVGYYRLPQKRRYYDDVQVSCGILAARVLEDVTQAIKEGSLVIDKKRLSKDARGAISGLSLYYHGENSGVWTKGLWPHATRGRPLRDIGDGVYIADYQITNIGRKPVIGVVCHELLHLVCGLPDSYDYGTAGRGTDDVIKSGGLGSHCMMSSANYLNGGGTPGHVNPYYKSLLGWVSFKNLPANGYVKIDTKDSVLYRYVNPANPKEFFILENVNHARNQWSRYTTAQGLMIWHADQGVKTGNELQQMSLSEHYEISLVQADGCNHLELTRPRMSGNGGDAQDAFDGSNVRGFFSDLTLPGAQWWDGANSGLNLFYISPPAPVITIGIGPRDGSVPLGR